jgi:hypothetical protein
MTAARSTLCLTQYRRRRHRASRICDGLEDWSLPIGLENAFDGRAVECLRRRLGRQCAVRRRGLGLLEILTKTDIAPCSVPSRFGTSAPQTRGRSTKPFGSTPQPQPRHPQNPPWAAGPAQSPRLPRSWPETGPGFTPRAAAQSLASLESCQGHRPFPGCAGASMALARREWSANKEFAGRCLVKLLASMSRAGTGGRVQLSARREQEKTRFIQRPHGKAIPHASHGDGARPNPPHNPDHPHRAAIHHGPSPIRHPEHHTRRMSSPRCRVQPRLFVSSVLYSA